MPTSLPVRCAAGLASTARAGVLHSIRHEPLEHDGSIDLYYIESNDGGIKSGSITNLDHTEQSIRVERELSLRFRGQSHELDVLWETEDVTDKVNAGITDGTPPAEANDILASLMDEGLIPREEFSHPLHHRAFDLWHYAGRTARFAAQMQGPGHTQWQGIYPLMRAMSEIEESAAELRGASRTEEVPAGE